MYCIDNRASLVLLLGAFNYLLLGATATTYNVYPSGGELTINEAMSLAEAGDTVSLADGTYDEAIVSKRDGTESSPITVKGGRSAVINGGYSSRNVLITHSYITLEGFSVQGKLDSSGDEDSYIVKCVYVEGPLEGFVMDGLSVENCGTECVRLKNSVKNSELTDNDIEHCGIYYYEFDSGSDKNGEGIYIGTSSDQTDDLDECNNNRVKGNTISTNGNECVDIKEGSTGNVIEYNICSNQLDSVSGCYQCRGDGNTLRYNEAFDCTGAGIKLGGNKIDGHQYGVDNKVYGNDFEDVGNGALRIMYGPQDEICGNSCEGGSGCTLTGNAEDDYLDSWDQSC